MSHMKYRLRMLLLSALLVCAWHNAMAQHEGGQPPRDRTFLAQKDQGAAARISLADAIEIVRRNTGGRVLNAQESRRDGRDGYRIKVLIGSGEVRVFFVDARGGSMQQD